MLKRRKTIAILIGLLITAVYTCFLEGITIVMTDFDTMRNIMIFGLYAYISIFAGSSLCHLITCMKDEDKNIYSCLKNDYMMQYCLFSFLSEMSLETTIAVMIILGFKIFNNVKDEAGVIVALTIIGVIGIVSTIKAHKKAVKSWEKY